MADGRADIAYATLIGGVVEGSGDSGYLGLLAVAALKIMRPGEAQVIYQKLVELEPEQGKWWAGLALSNEQLGLDSAPAYRELLALTGATLPLRELAFSRLRVG